MRVAVVGGKLQGIETCYLAHRAGWEVVLIDRDPSAPASGLCGTFVTGDILKEPKQLTGVIRHVDLVIPAVEDLESLRFLAKVSTENGIPLALDLRAYDTTAFQRL